MKNNLNTSVKVDVHNDLGKGMIMAEDMATYEAAPKDMKRDCDTCARPGAGSKVCPMHKIDLDICLNNQARPFWRPKGHGCLSGINIITAEQKPGSGKKFKPKNNQKKTATALFKSRAAKLLAEVDTTEQGDTMSQETHSEVDTITMDLDDMVEQICERAGYPKLYEALKKSALRNMRPPHLQALFLVTRALMKEA